MHLTRGGAIEHFQKLYYISVASITLECVPCAVETEDEPIWHSGLGIDIIPIGVMIWKCLGRHDSSAFTDWDRDT